VKTIILAVLAATLAPAWGQNLDLKFDAIAAKASEKAEIDLDAPVVALFLKNASGIDGLSGVIVRNYEFANPGAYAESDLDPLRRQVRGSGWSRIVCAKETGETTEVYVFSSGGKPAGFLIINTKPKELTVMQVKGTIQLGELRQVEDLVPSRFAFNLRNIPAAKR
jgi:hypothetical protein